MLKSAHLIFSIKIPQPTDVIDVMSLALVVLTGQDNLAEVVIIIVNYTNILWKIPSIQVWDNV